MERKLSNSLPWRQEAHAVTTVAWKVVNNQYRYTKCEHNMTDQI